MKAKKEFIKSVMPNLIVVIVGILLYFTLSNFRAVSSAIRNLLAAISPFIVGIAIAYLLNIPMRFFEEKVFKRLRKKRMLSILVTYVLALFVVGLFLGMIVPQLIDSISMLIGNIQDYFNNINRLASWLGETMYLEQETMDIVMVSYKDLLNQLVTYIHSILPQILSMTMRIGTGIISMLTALIASVYMLAGKQKLIQQCRRVLYAVLPKSHADNLERIGRLSNGVFSSFISGKLIDSAIVGVICFVFMSVMNLSPVKMPYALLISVIIGATNVIPFFGPFIGAIPSVLILLMINPWSALWFVIFIIVLQQFDGNYLGPKILGDSTGLPAIWVLIAIVASGGLFGFVGMLFGVPTAAVLYTLSSDFIENRLKKKGLTNAIMQDPQGGETAEDTDAFVDTSDDTKSSGDGAEKGL